MDNAYIINNIARKLALTNKTTLPVVNVNMPYLNQTFFVQMSNLFNFGYTECGNVGFIMIYVVFVFCFALFCRHMQ